MREFIEKHKAQITGVLSGFDRLVFHGFLRGISFPAGMESFLHCAGVLLKDFKTFALKTSTMIQEASKGRGFRSGTSARLFAKS